MFGQQLRPDGVGMVDGNHGTPRAGSHYNLGTSRGPDKIGSRAGPGPRAVSCTWLIYIHVGEMCFIPMNVHNELFNGVRQLRWQYLSPVVSTFST